jgi:hypothetical protein
MSGLFFKLGYYWCFKMKDCYDKCFQSFPSLRYAMQVSQEVTLVKFCVFILNILPHDFHPHTWESTLTRVGDTRHRPSPRRLLRKAINGRHGVDIIGLPVRLAIIIKR